MEGPSITNARAQQSETCVRADICISYRTAYSIMRYEDDINTDHNSKSIGRTAVAQVDKAPDSQWTNASSNPSGAHF